MIWRQGFSSKYLFLFSCGRMARAEERALGNVPKGNPFNRARRTPFAVGVYGYDG